MAERWMDLFRQAVHNMLAALQMPNIGHDDEAVSTLR